MIKRFIERIVEAIMSILNPKLDALEKKIEEKLVILISLIETNNEKVHDVNKVLSGFSDDMLTKIQELKNLETKLETKLETLQNSVFELEKLQEKTLNSIPLEMQEERERQEQEIIRTKLEVEKMEDEKDYDQLVWDIKSKLNSGEEVIIEGNLDYQVIQMLLCESEIKIDFQEGKLIISKKTVMTAEVAIDLEEMRKDYNEKLEIQKQLKRDSMIKKQIDYLDDCISQLSKNLQENPNQLPESILNLNDPDNPFVMSYEEVFGVKSAMEYKLFVITSPIVQYLRNRNIVFRIDKMHSTDKKTYWLEIPTGGYVISNDCNLMFGYYKESSNVGDCIAFEVHTFDVRLHVMNKEELEK